MSYAFVNVMNYTQLVGGHFNVRPGDFLNPGCGWVAWLEWAAGRVDADGADASAAVFALSAKLNQLYPGMVPVDR